MQINNLPILQESQIKIQSDWLINPPQIKTQIFRNEVSNEIILTNGLISRTFRISPNCATIGFDNLQSKNAMIRGIKPESVVRINDIDYNVGGLIGQIEYGYLLYEWLDDFTSDPNAFQYVSFDCFPIKERFSWKKTRYVGNAVWPPKGLEVAFKYIHPKLKDIEIEIHYEMYDQIPVLCKWLSIKNLSTEIIHLDSFKSEILALCEIDSVCQGDPTKGVEQPLIYMESDYIFASMSPRTGNCTSVWSIDPQYTSQVAYLNNSLVLLESRPPIGPDLDIDQNKNFESYRTYELLFDGSDRERRFLSIRRMYRIIAPWITENPIIMHSRSANPIHVKTVIDQCVELGFEMVILTFGSGIDMEIDDPEYYEEFQELFTYAKTKGIEIGSYSLFSSRNIDSQSNVKMPIDHGIQKSPVFGNAPCLCSQWGIEYIKKLKNFMTNTHANMIEHDGPYPGDVCASTKHPGHRGLGDSQWTQWQLQCEFYQWCRANGIYINAPDWYFLNGSNKTGMGYKEVNWSLPRERQIILGRQNIYDGSWEKTPSMGWMFTPLSVYHMTGEWQKSSLEPLSTYKWFYEQHLQQNFLSGVQSCYRGMKLYDTDEVKQMVKKWVDLYRKYRAILDSDIIHLRRPDGRHIDGIMHVNAQLPQKGLAVFYNPQNKKLEDRFKLPLYYTGLTEKAVVSEFGKNPQTFTLSRDYSIEIELKMDPHSTIWYVIE